MRKRRIFDIYCTCDTYPTGGVQAMPDPDPFR